MLGSHSLVLALTYVAPCSNHAHVEFTNSHQGTEHGCRVATLHEQVT